MLQHQRTRRNETGDLRITEITQQAEDVSLDRLLPNALSWGEVASGIDRVEPLGDGGGMQRQHARFPDARDDHRHLLRMRLEPIHHRQRLLHLVADEMAPELIALAVNPLPFLDLILHISPGAQPGTGVEDVRRSRPRA